MWTDFEHAEPTFWNWILQLYWMETVPLPTSGWDQDWLPKWFEELPPVPDLFIQAVRGLQKAESILPADSHLMPLVRECLAASEQAVRSTPASAFRLSHPFRDWTQAPWCWASSDDKARDWVQGDLPPWDLEEVHLRLLVDIQFRTRVKAWANQMAQRLEVYWTNPIWRRPETLLDLNWPGGRLTLTLTKEGVALDLPGETIHFGFGAPQINFKDPVLGEFTWDLEWVWANHQSNINEGLSYSFGLVSAQGDPEAVEALYQALWDLQPLILSQPEIWGGYAVEIRSQLGVLMCPDLDALDQHMQPCRDVIQLLEEEGLWETVSQPEDPYAWWAPPILWS